MVSNKRIRFPKLTLNRVVPFFRGHKGCPDFQAQPISHLHSQGNIHSAHYAAFLAWMEQRFTELQTNVALKIKSARQNAADHSETDITSIGATIRQQCTEALNSLKARMKVCKEEIETSIVQLTHQLSEQSDEDRAEDYIAQHKARSITNRVENAQVEGNVPVLKEQLRQKKADLRLAQNKHEDFLKEKYDFSPPERQWYNNDRLYKSFLGLLFTAETVLNFFAIQALGDSSNLFIPFLTLVLSFVLAACAHFTGTYLSSRKLSDAMTALLIGFFLLLVVIVMRITTAASTPQSTGGVPSLIGAAIFCVFILSFFGFAVLLARTREDNQPYFRVEDRLKKLGRETADLEAHLLQNEKKRQDREARDEAMREESERNALRKAKSDVSSLKKSIAIQESEIRLLENHENDFHSRILSLYNETIGEFLLQLSQARRREGLEEIRFADHPIKLIDGTKPSGSGDNSLSGIQSLYIGLWLFGLTSCTELPEKKEVIVIIDQTAADSSFALDRENLAGFLLENMEFDTSKASSDEVKVTFTTLGDVSIQPFRFAVLKKGKPYWLRVEAERRAEIRKFLSDLNAAIAKIQSPAKDGLEKSYVHDCLCQYLVPLARSDADLKKAVLFSDMLENSEKVNFYDYRLRPEGIGKNYESIAQKLQERCPLPELNGMEVTIVHLPDRKDDALFQAAWKFWSRYLEGRGVQLNFLPNI